MEHENTRANIRHLPKRLISLLLSLVMLLQLVPAMAFAASVDYEPLRKAIQHAIDAGTIGQYTTTESTKVHYQFMGYDIDPIKSDDRSKTITDNSADSSIWNIAVAFQTVYQSLITNSDKKLRYTSGLCNTIWNSISGKITDKNSGKATAEGLIKFLSYSDAFHSYVSTSNVSDKQWDYTTGASPQKSTDRYSDYPAPSSITVKRSAESAFCGSGYTSIPSSNPTLNTSFRYTINCAVNNSETTVESVKKEKKVWVARHKENGKWIAGHYETQTYYENVTYYINQYSYISSLTTNQNINTGSIDNTLYNNLKTYFNFFKDTGVFSGNVATFKSLYDNANLSTLASSAQAAKNAGAAAKEANSTVFNQWLKVYSSSDEIASKVESNISSYIARCTNASQLKAKASDITKVNSLVSAGYDSSDKTAMEELQKTLKGYLYGSDGKTGLNLTINTLLNNGVSAQQIEDSGCGLKFTRDGNNKITKTLTAIQFYNKLGDDISSFDIILNKNKIDSLIANINSLGGTGYAENERPTMDGKTLIYYDLRSVKDDNTISSSYDRLKGFSDTLTKQAKEHSSVVTKYYPNGTNYVTQYLNALNWEKKRRAAKTDFSEYYSYFVAESSTPISSKSASLATRLTELKKKLGELKDDITAHENAIGTSIADALFPAVYDESYTRLDKEMAAYIQKLIYGTDESELDSVDEIFTKEIADLNAFMAPYSKLENPITIDNFSTFISYYTSLSELKAWFSDSDNLNWVKANFKNCGDPISSDALAAYNKLSSWKASYDKFIKNWDLNSLEKEEISYPTREGSTSDYARSTGDDYTVTHDNLSSTVTKLDDFLGSEDFAQFLSLDISDEYQEKTLRSYINQVIGEKLFNDETVNTIFATIYPKIAELLNETLNEKIEGGLQLSELLKNAEQPEWLLTSVFDIHNMSGKISIYVDQNKYNGVPSKDFVDLFKSARLFIYPCLLEEYYTNTYYDAGTKKWSDNTCKAIATALHKIDYDKDGNPLNTRTWDAFIPDGKHHVEFNFDWGIDKCTTTEARYAAFCAALGKLFDPILPLLKCILGGNTSDAFQVSATDSVYITVTDFCYPRNIFKDITGYMGASANLDLSIDPVNGYKTIWVPLMEALGLNTAANSEAGYAGMPYSFGSINTATSADMVKALFDPILSLVNQVSDKPISSVMNMLPTLSYFISFDGISTLLEKLELTLHYDVKEAKLDSNNTKIENLGKLLSNGVSDLFNLIFENRSLVNDKTSINLGKEIDLNEILGEGTNITDINSVLRAVLTIAELPSIDIPIMSVGKLVKQSYASTNYQTQRAGGARTYLVADTADVFYTVFNWLMSSLGTEGFIENLIGAINKMSIDSAKEGETPETITLPDLVINMLRGLEKTPDQALAALVELVNPKEDGYAFETMDWFDETAYETANKDVEGFNAASTVYLDNGNNWTQEKAQYIIDNIDNVINGILEMSGMEGEDIVATTLKEGVESIFVNKNITGVVKALSGIRDSLDKSLIEVLRDETAKKDAGGNVISPGVDLSLWGTAFGYLFDNNDKTNTRGTGLDRLSVALNPAPKDEKDLYIWSLDGQPLKDGDTDGFSDMLCYLLDGFAPLVGFLFNNTDITLFNGAVKLKGYACYEYSIAYLFDAIGVTKDANGNDGYLTGAAYQAAYANDPTAGISYIIKTFFTRVDEVIEDPIHELLTALPKLIYFIESDGISTVVKNFAHPLLVLLDTARPILGPAAEVSNLVVPTLVASIAEDADLSEKEQEQLTTDLYFSLNDLSLETLLNLGNTLLGATMGVDIKSILSPALRTFCINREEITTSNSASDKNYTVNVSNADTLTILISSILELLQYGDNAKNLDAYLVKKGILEGDSAGILAAIVKVFDAPVTDMLEPNWAYTFKKAMQDPDYEGPEEVVFSSYDELQEIDLSAYHTINYLAYDSDWQKSTATYLTENLDTILLSLLQMNTDEAEKVTTLSAYIGDLNIYSPETIAKVATFLKDTVSRLDDDLVKLIDQMIGTKLEVILAKGYKTDAADFANVTDRASFVAALTDLLKPVAPALEFLLLGQNYEYFTASGIVKGLESKGNAESIIKLHGAEGYQYGIIPLLEALGCTNVQPASKYVTVTPASPDGKTPASCTLVSETSAEQLLDDLLMTVCTRMDEILADPSGELLELLPNLFYFINSDGLTAAVNNSLRALVNVLNAMGQLNDEVDIYDVINKSIGFRINDLSFTYFFQLIKELTTKTDKDGTVIQNGLDLASNEALVEKIETFYIGNMQYYTSANGRGAFRMVYSTDEDRADMLTILASFVLEAICYGSDSEQVGNNIEKLISIVDKDNEFGDLIRAAVKVLRGAEPQYHDLSYFGRADYQNDPEVKSANENLAYLEYGTDWQKEDVDYVFNNMDEIINLILSMVSGDTDETTQQGEAQDPKTLNDLMKVDIYNEKTINAVLEFLQNALKKLDPDFYSSQKAEPVSTVFGENSEEESATAPVLTFVSKMIGCDLNDILEYTSPETFSDRETFISTLTDILQPANKLVRYLCLGEDYAYFRSAVDGADSQKQLIINLKGGLGYEKGLKPLLEILKCDSTKLKAIDTAITAYNEAVTAGDTAEQETQGRAFMYALIDCLCAKIDEFCKDPVNTVMDVLPNLIYYINADGLQMSIYNLIAPFVSIINNIPAIPMDLKVLFNATDNLGFGYFLGLLESKTSVAVPENLKAFLSNYFFGELNTTTGQVSYTEAQTKADMLTVLLSVAIELVEYTDDKGVSNATKIDQMIAEGKDDEDDTISVAAILSLLKPNGLSTTMQEIDWGSAVPETPLSECLKYGDPDVDGNIWTRDTAENTVKNLDTIVANLLAQGDDYKDALKKDSSAKKSFELLMKNKIFSAATINSITGSINDALAKLDPTILNLAAQILDCEVSYADTDTEKEHPIIFKHYDESEIQSKEDFEKAFTSELMHLEKLLKFVLADEDITLFTASGKASFGTDPVQLAEGSNLITLDGNDGYSYGLVPILEALGCSPKSMDELKETAKAENKTLTAVMLNEVVHQLCSVIEKYVICDIAADKPMLSLIEQLPTLIFFINSGGLTVSANNLLAPVDQLIQGITAAVGEKKTLNSLIKDFDLDNITFEQLFTLVKDATAQKDKSGKVTAAGLDLSGILPYIKAFYFGQWTDYESANGQKFVKLTCTDKDAADIVTALFSLLCEIVGTDGNAEALDRLFKTTDDQLFVKSVEKLRGKAPDYEGLENPEYYLNKTTQLRNDTLSYLDSKYRNDWQSEDADYVISHFDEIVTAILKMAGEDKSLEELLNINIYNAQTVQKVLTALQDALKKLDKSVDENKETSLLNFIGKLTGCDLIQLLDIDPDKFADVNDQASFVAAMAEILQPANKLVRFLCLGEDYRYFNRFEADDKLITLAGGEGYIYGLRPLLERLGCKTDELDEIALKFKGTENVAEREELGNQFVIALLNSLCQKVNEFRADPVNTVIAVLPDLIYYINAGGLQMSVYNLIAPVTDVAKTIKVDLSALTEPVDNLSFSYFLELAEDSLDITVPAKLKTFLDTFFFGEMNGEHVIYDQKHTPGQLLTVLLSAAVEIVEYKDNAAKLDAKFETDGAIATVLSLLKPHDETKDQENPLRKINWNTVNKETPKTTDFLSYANDWDEDTAEYVVNNVDALVATILKDQNPDAKSFEDLMDNKIFSSETLNAITGAANDALAKLDPAVLKLIAQILDCEGSYDGENHLVLFKTYPAGQIQTQKDFETALTAELMKLEKILAFILADQDITLFVSSDMADKDSGESLITFNGANGYANALVPILEALGFNPENIDNPKGMDYFLSLFQSKPDVDPYELTESMVTEVVHQLCNIVAQYVTSDIATDKPLLSLIGKLPNLIYFINAGGLTAAVNNLLYPVDYLLKGLYTVAGKDISLNALIEDFDLEQIDFTQVIPLVKDKTGIDMSMIQDALTGFNLGRIDKFDSANGDNAYRMICDGVDGTQDAGDVITTIICMLCTVFENKDNAKALDKLCKTDGLFTDIMELLTGLEPEYYTPERIDYYKDADNSALAYLTYPNDWEKADAKYLVENVNALITAILNMNSEEGAEKTISDLIGADIYTNDTVKSILGALQKGLNQLDPTLLQFIGQVIGCDPMAILNYDTSKLHVTDQASFVAAMTEILQPANKLVRFLCLGESYHFFNSNADGDEKIITITGGEGYEKGLKSLLITLGCNVDTIDNALANFEAPENATQKQINEAKGKVFVSALLTCLCSRIDTFLSDPVNSALTLLPQLIYYVNSAGLQASAYNLIAPLMTVAEKLPKSIHLDLSSLTSVLDNLGFSYFLGLAEESTGIVIPNDMKDFLDTFFIGEMKIDQKDQHTVITTAQDQGDLITVLLSMAVEILEYSDENTNNAKVLDAKLKTEGTVEAILKLVQEYDESGDLHTIHWDVLTAESPKTDTYLSYPNNWNEDTAQYLVSNLDTIVADVLDAVEIDGKGNVSSVEDLLDNKVFSAHTLNLAIDAINKALKDVDPTILQAVEQLLNCQLSFEPYEDSAIQNRDQFEAAVVNELCKFQKVLAFLLMDKDITFLVSSGMAGTDAGKNLITINGADGYNNALVPILEALGIAPADAASFNGDVKAMVTEVVHHLCGFVDDYVVSDIRDTKPLLNLVEKLPNLIYFINAGGLTASVNNLLLPIEYLLEGISPIAKKDLSLNTLIDGFDLNQIDFTQFIPMIEESTDLDLSMIEDYILTFNIGTLDPVNHKLICSEADARDVVTTIICLLGEVLKSESNEATLEKLMGEDAYAVMLGLFHPKAFKMQEIDWLFQNDPLDTVYNMLTTTKVFSNQYGPNYTKEMAAEIAENFDVFVDDTLAVLGIQMNGQNITSLGDLLNQLVGTSVYTPDVATALYDALIELNGKINDLPASKHIKEVLKTSLGVDLSAYDRFDKSLLNFTEGDRGAFVKAVTKMLQPLYPVLKWLLCNQNISFFVDESHTNAVTLLGAEGYRNGIIPLLEVLTFNGTDNAKDYGVKTQEQYYADIAKDPDALLTDIINPLFNRLDDILADPANEIFAMLPNLIYFINSKGLDTCWKNSLNAIYTLLKTVEPLVKVDLYELMGIDLESMTFDSLLDLAFDAIAKSTGYQLKSLVMDEIAELTNGKREMYTSLSGKTAYRMVYCNVDSEAATATTLMRVATKFISCEENAEKLKSILHENDSVSEEGYKYYSSLINYVAEYATTDRGIDTVLYTMYEVFNALQSGVSTTKQLTTSFNERYNFVYNALQSSDNSALKEGAKLLQRLFTGSNGSDNKDSGGSTGGLFGFVTKAFSSFTNIFSSISNTISSFFKGLFRR